LPSITTLKNKERKKEKINYREKRMKIEEPKTKSQNAVIPEYISLHLSQMSHRFEPQGYPSEAAL
jgi:hypothetical protein